MAKFGGVNLYDSDKELFAGAAFQLSKPSELSKKILLPNLEEVEIVKENSCAVARIKNMPRDLIPNKAYTSLQKGLDFLSASGLEDLTLTKANEDYIYWWQEDSINHICIVSSLIQSASVPTLKVNTGTDEKSKDSLIASSDHPGFRYFRLAQITEDLHDAYRNMFLAFELTLSRNFPKKNERESDWIKRAIKEAEPDLSLSSLLKIPSDDVHNFVFNKFYKDARLPLFHAKFNRKFLAPQSFLNDREVIADALNNLTKVVLRMFDVWHNTRRKGGAVYPHFLYDSFRKTCKNLKMVFSDHIEFDPNETNLKHSRFKNGIISSRINVLDDDKGRPYIYGEVDLNNNEKGFTKIQRVDIIKDDIPLFAIRLESELNIKDIQIVHLDLKYRIINVNQPKVRFEL